MFMSYSPNVFTDFVYSAILAVSLDYTNLGFFFSYNINTLFLRINIEFNRITTEHHKYVKISYTYARIINFFYMKNNMYTRLTRIVFFLVFATAKTAKQTEHESHQHYNQTDNSKVDNKAYPSPSSFSYTSASVIEKPKIACLIHVCINIKNIIYVLTHTTYILSLFLQNRSF